MEQNIIAIGYDPKFQPEIEAVTKSLLEQYNLLKKIDETKISPGSGGGFTELKAQVDALAKSNKALMESNVKMAQSLADLNNKQAESVSSAKQVVTSNQQVTLSYNDAIKKLNDAKSALASNSALQKQLTKDVQAGKISADEYRLKLTQLTNTQLKYKETVTQLNKELKDQARVAVGLLSPYDLLSKKYNEAAKNALNLAAAHGAESAQAKAAALTANKLHVELLTIDQTVGKSQRNVGNYAGGIQKAFGGLRTLANILPGVGISGLFLLGYEAVEKLIKSMSTLGSRLSDTIRQSRLLSDINKEMAKNAGSEIASLETLYKVATNANIPIKERKKAVDELQNLYPDYFKNIKDEIILQGKAGEAYAATRLQILEMAKTKAIESKLSEIATKELEKLQQKEEALNKQRKNQDAQRKADLLKTDPEGRGLAQFNAISEGSRIKKEISDVNSDLLELGKDREFLLNQITNAGVKTEKATKEKSAKDLKDLADKTAEEILRINYELARRLQQRNVDDAKAAYEADGISYQNRLIALSKYFDEKVKLSDLDRDYEIEAENLKYKEIQDNLKAQKPSDVKGGQAAINAQLQREATAHFLRMVNIESKYYDERRKLGIEYLADIKRQEEKREADSKKAFDEDIKRQEKVVKSWFDQQKILDDAKKRKSKEDIDREKEKNKIILDGIRDFTNSAIDLIDTLVDAGYTRQQNAIQRLIEANNEYQAVETERIANSTLSEQEKAAKIITLNASVAAKNKQLAQEQKEMDIKKAEFDKKVGIAKIILNTAIGVASALIGDPYTAALRAGIVLALGAVALAAAIATPIPTYAEGTENHPGGYAITGEGKHAEMILEPGKKPYIVDQATLSNLPAGTKVKPLTGDYINEAMYGSMMTSTAERMALADAIENKRMQTDWAIARYLAGELKQQPQRKQPIQVVNKIDMGFASYINNQIFGRS